jgi:hypothetical protein
MVSLGGEIGGAAADIRRSLVRAYDAGVEAEGAIGAIAAPPPAPPSTNWLFARSVADRVRRGISASAGPDQVRRACDHLDEFAVALSDCMHRIGDQALEGHASDRAEWAKRVWASNKNAAEVYNEVRGTMATLHSYRINGLPNGVPLAPEP